MFLIAICCQCGDKWLSKTLFLTIFDLRSSIVLAFSITAYPVWEWCSGWIWQTRGSILLLLLGGYALWGWRMWTWNDYTCENRLEKFQGAAACSFIMPPLLQDPRSCVQLMCLECDASCKPDLALDKSRYPVLTPQWQSHDQTDL